MARMAGYQWAVTGAAIAFAAFVALDFGTDVWATRNGLDLLTELAGVMLVSVLFGLYGWVFAFLTAWPLFLLTTGLAETFKTRSLVYFTSSGALTGALLSLPLLALPGEDEDLRSAFEIATRVVSLCMLYGVSGAWLFWWKVIRCKPA